MLWCHSHLVWLVFEGFISTCACFHSQNFFETSVHCRHPEHNSLSMHIKMHYIPRLHYPRHCLPQPSSAQNKHKTYLCKWRQNGTTTCRMVAKCWCRSHLVWLVFEGSIPTCTCFCSENFDEFINIISSGEQNQRALVGREALVNPGADQTSDEAINRTRRY